MPSNKLCDDKMFKVVTGYIFPLKKLTSLWATYSDMSFLSSIGEVTVPTGDTLGNQTLSTKPGAHSYSTQLLILKLGTIRRFYLTGNAGLASAEDRKEIDGRRGIGDTYSGIIGSRSFKKQ